MALPVSPIGSQFARLVWREAYARWLDGEVARLLRLVYQELAGRIAADLDVLPVPSRARLFALYAQVDQLLGSEYHDLGDVMIGHLGGFARAEIDATTIEFRHVFGADFSLSASSASLSRELVTSIARLPIQGLRLGEWWTAQASTLSRRVRSEIQTGLTLGEGPRAIAARVAPPAQRSSSVSAYNGARRDAVTIARTATTAVHNDASVATYRAAGPSVVDELRIRAVLDARTSTICRAKDSTRVKIDKAEPGVTIPPFHLQCRSTTEPIIDYRAHGLKPPASIGGNAWPSYESWLRAQTKGVQNEIMGAQGADLWRSGKVSLREFVADDNRVLSLDELRDKYGAP